MSTIRTKTKEDDANRKAIGSFLRQRRIELNLSQKYMSDMMQLNYYTFISQLEKGSTRVPSKMIDDIARVLKLKRKEFAKLLLAYYDPQFYQAIFESGPPELVYEELIKK